MQESVLVIDDEPLVSETLSEFLRPLGFEVETTPTLREATQRLGAQAPSAVLLDLQLPDGHGLDLLPRLRSQWPGAAVIVMTGHASISTAVQAIKEGAFHYVQKPLHLDEMEFLLRKAIETTRLVQRVQDEELRNRERYSLDGVIARSPGMQKVLQQIGIVAASRAATVLLLGESGTGKGMVAGALHYASSRAPHPFLKVTCSAIPEPLLEAEMFGHERGAFTDAKQRRRGVFEAADRGTVFLDEIGDMPLTLQAKLLGVIEDRSFSRVGGTQRVEVDVRIIAATHRDLERAAEEGRFRDDLLYRLRVVPIIIPALRDRPEDVEPLAEHFLEEFNREFGRNVAGFDESARKRLRSHPWPGNVRELRNVIERAMLFTENDRLTSDDLLIDLGYRPRSREARAGASGFVLPPEGVTLEAVEQELIRQAMERSGNNQSRAAMLLGLTRDQIRYRLDKMGMLPGGKSD